MKRINDTQEKMNQKIKVWHTNLKEKQKRTLKFIPRIIIFMMLCVYFSGFLYTTVDDLFLIFTLIILAVFILFVPLGKIVAFCISRLDQQQD